jgi:hypothetical protein
MSDLCVQSLESSSDVKDKDTLASYIALHSRWWGGPALCPHMHYSVMMMMMMMMLLMLMMMMRVLTVSVLTVIALQRTPFVVATFALNVVS